MEGQPRGDKEDTKSLKEQIKANFHYLVHNIDLNVSLRSALRQADILTRVTEESIVHGKPDTEQVKSLLDYLLKRPEEDLAKFCQCLVKDNQGHIVQRCFPGEDPGCRTPEPLPGTLTGGSTPSGTASRAKNVRFTAHQRQILQKAFAETSKPSKERILQLGQELQASETKIRNWFSNERSKANKTKETKRKTTNDEVSSGGKKRKASEKRDQPHDPIPHAQDHSSNHPDDYIKGYIDQQKRLFNQKIFNPEGPFPDASKHIESMIYVAKEITKLGQQGLEEFTEAKILKSRVQRVVQPEELFTALEDLGEESDPRTVLLHGPPGIGKTTLCYKLLYDINGSDLFPNSIPYVIRMRDINTINEVMSFKQLLLDKHGRKYGKQDNWMDGLFSHIEEQQDKIIILIDGYDESENLGANPKAEYMKITSDVNKEERPEKLIYSLIEGSILPGAKVFLTSRSYAIGSLKKHVERVMELEGFTDKRLKRLFENEFGKEKGLQVLEYLKLHPRLLGLCYVPRHALCLIEFLKSKGLPKKGINDIAEPIPQSMAHLMFCLVIQILEKSCTDLKDAKPINDTQVLLQKRLTSQITHMTGTHEVAWLLYCGLSGDPSLRSPLKVLLNADDDHMEELTSKARQVIRAYIHHTCPKEDNQQLFCINALSEGSIWGMSDEVASELVNTPISQGQWTVPPCPTPADAAAVGQFLSHLTQKIDCIKVNDKAVHVKYLVTEQAAKGYTMLSTTKYWDVIVKAVNKNIVRAVAMHIEKGHKLVQRDCPSCLPPVVYFRKDMISAQSLSNNISRLSNMQTLLLQKYNVQPLLSRDKTGSPVLCTLQQLKHLGLRECHIKDTDIPVLVEVVTTRQLEYLSLRDNRGIHAGGANKLAQCLASGDCSLKALSVHNCNIPHKACNTLYQAASKNTKLHILDIDGNKWTGTGVYDAERAEDLSETGPGTSTPQAGVKELWIGGTSWSDRVELTNVDCSFTQVLCMEAIKVTQTLIDSLAAGISTNNTLQCLSLHDCELSSEHMNRLTDAFLKNTALTALNLSGTTVPAACIIRLITHLHLTALNVSCWGLSEQDANAVGHAVCTCPTLCWVGLGEVFMEHADAFLQRLQHSYPDSGPLKHVRVWNASPEVVRETETQLRTRLDRNTRIGYEVSDGSNMYMAYHYHLVQEGLVYSCLPQDIRWLLWKADHYPID